MPDKSKEKAKDANNLPMKTIELRVGTKDKIYEVKDKLFNKEGVHRDKQMLFERGMKMSNYYSIEDYKIKNDTTITMLESLPKGDFNVNVRMKSGKQFSIAINSEYNMRDVKLKIKEKENLEVED